ncbi:bifunctional DNA-formamidopyrimidine glycosylase/DNA-(apurinic or apyrimidinic site) lyase [Dethiosulfatarculus sandiegensis]|uniref:Formamidopyrimidine-DNA glycosylase n=1 Tax=Dethiosulfatarculus sandiegensis TaxID=1429043 RepID=A0A0D2GMZ9_9BACT|nr:bifunctional DNA-formamidopyrimidine glycosylase/DNA-(apurinic or apyrimidinic site) lyase [Dethiosulfatarculus sandiegensis]KIX15992.1 formamidopyrimidine-DNA glycosylase [Dethiosulfatarculus sandiegensis]
MPELPEVECVRRTLAPVIIGKNIINIVINLEKIVRPDPLFFQKGLLNKRIVQVDRHGKLLIVHLENSSFWAIHLGMTGQIILREKQPDLPHIHACIHFNDQSGFFFRDVRQFGFMAYLPNKEALQKGPLKNMGPDALMISLETFTKSLAGRKAPIKSLLLDQRILAGVGNIYADESLFRAGIAPTSRAGEIPPKALAKLHRILRELLGQAIDCGGSSIRDYVDAKGEAGSFQDLHQVYGHKGAPCPICGREIKKITLGGRSTHYCRHCQKCY